MRLGCFCAGLTLAVDGLFAGFFAADFAPVDVDFALAAELVGFAGAFLVDGLLVALLGAVFFAPSLCPLFAAFF